MMTSHHQAGDGDRRTGDIQDRSHPNKSYCTLEFIVRRLEYYLFIGQNRGRNPSHRLGVIWYISIYRAVSHHIEFARMYACRQYHRCVRSPTGQELREPNHPKDVIGVSIYVDIRYLRPHFYSYPLMPSMTGTGVLQVRA